MLSVPTLWTVSVTNFFALGLVWVYVSRCYPKFEAARFWTAAAFTAIAGAAASMLRGVVDFSLLLIGCNALLTFACWFVVMGVQRFYNLPISWRMPVLGVGVTCIGLAYFQFVQDDMPMRIAIYSLGQIAPAAVTLHLLMTRRDDQNPGARLAAICCALLIIAYGVRSGLALMRVGGDLSIVDFNGIQAALILIVIFLSMAWNFGLLLMAIDRLRNEVADLALLDDLTGVGNRRHFVQRLTEECARSVRSGEPFALLVIDLDGFKGINDTHGHAAGDACLQHFALMAQTRLRPADMLARSGGDEFCIVLPSSTLAEGAMIARRVLEVCRADAAECSGQEIPIAVSIGVAQWTREIGAYPDRLIAAADRALYEAKKRGRDGYAISEPAPPLVPEIADMPDIVRRKTA
ncbi:GGDEF domain-containing protein [Bradyrhizobium neotropicale]|uniref:GGDEF domain-containing protein n=1 Tax=Bradyrhizobium neotropicale TaxID=1497615 RepID=UPI001AD6B5FE|nr:GGDEF domain-containing protein [Bradyrhizobium neotropicale]MBO4224025.1 diguanylate cyclase [Bradyrhizobium neotropicale]